jgi:hypothetical protein
MLDREEEMLSPKMFAAPVIALTALVTACASQPRGGSLSDYVGVSYTNIETRCGGGYQVYRQPVNGRLLVVAYAISEAFKSACEARRGAELVPTKTGVRYEEAALEYIEKTPGMKGCTIVSGTEITRLHSEFIVACPASATQVIRAKG